VELTLLLRYHSHAPALVGSCIDPSLRQAATVPIPWQANNLAGGAIKNAVASI